MNAKIEEIKFEEITQGWLAALDDDEWEQLLVRIRDESAEIPAGTHRLFAHEFFHRMRQAIEWCIAADKEHHAFSPEMFSRKYPDTFAEWWEHNKETFPWDPSLVDDVDDIGEEPKQKV